MILFFLFFFSLFNLSFCALKWDEYYQLVNEHESIIFYPNTILENVVFKHVDHENTLKIKLRQKIHF